MMATRAEMEAELDVLRAKLAETEKEKAATSPPETNAADEAAPDAATGSDAGEAEDAVAAETSLSMAHAKSELDRLLTPYGVSVEEIEDLADQLWAELETMPQKKPLTSVIAAFALGFLVGRLSK